MKAGRRTITPQADLGLRLTATGFTRRAGLKMLAALPLAGAEISSADAGKAHTPSRTGTAAGHDGAPIRFKIYGRGTRFLMLRHATDSALNHLVDRYRVIMIDYLDDPKPYTLTPAAVTADHLKVADAAGAERFAYYGYSWGAVCGLQLAIRTHRLTALMCGGFPMLEGPYEEMLTVTTEHAAAAERSGKDFAARRQYLTYYQTLRGFDDRQAQASISCPRLCVVGADDVVRFPDGRPLARFGESVRRHKAELEKFGWTVRILPGKNHGTAREGDVIGPIIRPWLDANWQQT